MRRLTRPDVVTYSAAAAAASATLSVPRMLLWDKRPFALWYVEATIFFCSFVLWAFVFAWHTEYTHRPVFKFRIKSSLFAAATLAGLIAALTLYFLLDPLIRRVTPEDFPADLKHWLASTLFIIAFTQLFLVYAPFAWLMRLFRNEPAALCLTVGLGIMILILRNNSLPVQLPPATLAASLFLKAIAAYFAIWFYLRGGILLACWLSLIVAARHLLTLYNL